MSSRFGGKIKQFAKIGLGGETLIEISLNQALKAGFSKIIFIVGNMTEKPFREKFGNSYKGIPVYYALQKFDTQERDKPWGTTEAVISAEPYLNCPFAIFNGDDIYGENSFKILMNHISNSKEGAILGYKITNVLSEKGSVNRGLIEVENGYLKSIREIFNITRENLKEKSLEEGSLVSMNAFAFQQSILTMLKKRFENFKKVNLGDRKIECLLPNEIGELINSGEIKVSCLETPDEWIGVTNPEDEEIARESLKKISKQTL